MAGATAPGRGREEGNGHRSRGQGGARLHGIERLVREVPRWTSGAQAAAN